MKFPMFIKGQKLRVVSSGNKSLVGIDVRVEDITDIGGAIWDGKRNKEYIYSFQHEGTTYGAIESQLETAPEKHCLCGLSFEQMMDVVREQAYGE